MSCFKSEMRNKGAAGTLSHVTFTQQEIPLARQLPTAERRRGVYSRRFHQPPRVPNPSQPTVPRQSSQAFESDHVGSL